MGYIKSYKELIVWQKAVELVVEVYRLTKSFPGEEKYGLVSQMRRSSVSIPSNIAEGYSRGSRKEYHQFYSIAYGSGLELETQFIVSRKVGLCTKIECKRCDGLLEEVLKMLNSMLKEKRKLNARR